MSYVEKLARVAYWLIMIIGGVSVFQGAYWIFTDRMIWTDSTDGAQSRSGLKPHTDFGTGCQYLTSSLGGLTPRMGPDGKQICGDR